MSSERFTCGTLTCREFCAGTTDEPDLFCSACLNDLMPYTPELEAQRYSEERAMACLGAVISNGR